ncbi:MAG: DinB family protein [Acidobacteriota bacterium]|nr:DinB family protein [Acidobacteriota bacterium]
MTIAISSERNLMADQLERSFRGGAWHGPSLTEILGGLDPGLSSWRPAPGIQTILESVEHLSFWFEEARRRIEGGYPDPSPQDQSWGRAHEDVNADWETALAALESAHRGLREAILNIPEDALETVPPGSETDARSLLLGTLQHSAYHAAQIRLLRRLAESKAGSAP